MTWVRLDDNFPSHPKIVAISPLAGWLWVCGLAYCNRFLTDGAILSRALPSVAPTLRKPLHYVEELVQVGLWETREAGWQVHDYAEYQPSKADVLAERKATNERVTRWRQARNGVTNALVTPDVTVNVTPDVTLPRTRTRTRTQELPEATALSGTVAGPPTALMGQAKEVLDFLNAKTGRSYNGAASLKLIVARLKAGASVQDCKTVIAMKARKWLTDPKMSEYLRPKTLFSQTNFENYLGEREADPQ